MDVRMMPWGRGRFWAVLAALFLFQEALPARAAADPEEAQYNVVVTLYNAGQWQAALTKIGEREARPLSDAMRVKYLYARGLVLESGKKSEDARKAYANLVQTYPNAIESGKARLSLVYLDYAAKDLRSVVSNCAALKMDSLPAADRQKVAFMNAEAWVALQEPQKAVALYQQALALGADRSLVAPKLFGVYQSLQMHKELLDLSAAPIPGVAADALGTLRTEAFLAQGRNAEAEAEAGKVQPGSAYYARACFSLAQALIRQNKLKEAVAPLATAIRELRDPRPPASAHIALAECLLADSRPDEAEAAVNDGVKKADALAEQEKAALLAQAAILRVRTALALRDNKKLVKAVDAARASLPPDKLADILYARLFALHQTNDQAGILQTLKDDLPAFQDKPQEGNAVLIYFTACKQADRLQEGCALLESYIRRKPDTPESCKAKLELANAALTREDFAKAKEQLGQVLATAHAADYLGSEAFAEAQYNAAAVALRLNDPASAIATLQGIRKLNPTKAMTGRAMLLLGQIYAQTNDWKKAAEAWNEALTQGDGANETDLRDRLGRAWVAAGKPAEARSQFEALAKAAGGAGKLGRETREAWARTLFGLSDYTGAAALYEGMYRDFGSPALFAYEGAVCLERADQWGEAEKWYLLAEKGREALPAGYAGSLSRNLSRIRYKTGTGDRGFAYWLGKLAPSAPDADFEAAAPLLAKIAAAVAPEPAAFDTLESLMKQYGPANPRTYGIGAIALQAAASFKPERLGKLSAQLAADYADAEKTLPAGTWSTTVAPAMIHFFRGEAERLAGNQADALVSYETVLAAYPVNEWPDAAACGAAECYAALGDKDTAVAKLSEVVKSGASAKSPSKWVDAAKQRLAELTKAKGD